MYAWIIQRFSGVFLVFFVLTHITAIAQANIGITSGAQARIFDMLRNPFYMGGPGRSNLRPASPRPHRISRAKWDSHRIRGFRGWSSEA